MTWKWALLTGLIAGCSFDSLAFPPGGAGGDGGTADARDMDGNGGPDASADAARPPDATECVQECTDSNTLVDCSTGAPVTMTCPLGCLPAGTPHCGALVPSNGLSRDWLAGTTSELVVPSGETWVFDTDSGAITRCGGAPVRGSGPGIVDGVYFATLPAPSAGTSAIGVFAFPRLTVQQNATLRGVGGAALAILTSDAVDIQGVVTVSGGARACDATEACSMATGDRRCGGPGAGDGGGTVMSGSGAGAGSGGLGGDGSGVLEKGGGGGGFGDWGGYGGGIGGSPGGPYGAVDPIVGGSGGGGGGTDSVSAGGVGGGGGGAVQITSLTSIAITETGGMAAGVRAGGAGGGFATGTAGGGGGGSGGAILLEGPTVSIEFGRVTANGGGGGGTPSGANLAFPVPAAGEEGSFNVMVTPGGAGSSPGGAGGSVSSTTGAIGSPAGIDSDAGSGGGGGVGRVGLRARLGGVLSSSPAISPAATVSTITIE